MPYHGVHIHIVYYLMNQTPSSTDSNRLSNRSIRFIYCSVGVLIGVTILLLAFSHSTFTASANALLTDIRQDKIAEAYDNTATVFKSNTSKEQFEDFVKNHPVFYHSTTTSFTYFERHGSLARLVGTVADSNGYSLPLTVYLIKEEGRWKVAGFDIDIGTAFSR